MVEYTLRLDSVFSSLSDSTRRDILHRISQRSMSVSEVAKPYSTSLAAIAKHLEVLQRAGLIHKTRHGKQQIVSIEPGALAAANAYLESFQQLWEQRLDSLEMYLRTIDKDK